MFNIAHKLHYLKCNILSADFSPIPEMFTFNLTAFQVINSVKCRASNYCSKTQRMFLVWTIFFLNCRCMRKFYVAKYISVVVKPVLLSLQSYTKELFIVHLVLHIKNSACIQVQDKHWVCVAYVHTEATELYQIFLLLISIRLTKADCLKSFQIFFSNHLSFK